MIVDPSVGKLNARVCWGPRAETADGLAARWAATNRALEAVDPRLSGWAVSDEDGGSIPLAAEHLVPIIEAGTNGRPELGFNFGTVTDHANDPLFFHASAGFSAPIAGLLNVARLEGSADALGDLEAVLAALVAVWEPDHGQISAYAWIEAQHPGPREPWAGAVTYLSATRSRQVPVGLGAAARRTPDGGLLLSLVSPGGGLPDGSQIEALGARLREAGAFAPVPTDRPQWTDDPSRPD